jgi:hypothetical protein
MKLRNYILLGPFSFITKRQYGWGLLACLFQLSIPVQIMFTLNWSLYWPVFQEQFTNRQMDLSISDIYPIVITYYYCILAAPGLLLLVLVALHFMWGYFAYRHHKRYKKQMQSQGYAIYKNDKLSTYLTVLGFVGIFIGFVLAGVPYEHAFHPDPTDLFYTHQEAIKLLNAQIIGSLTIFLITIVYLVSRMVLKKQPQRPQLSKVKKNS